VPGWSRHLPYIEPNRNPDFYYVFTSDVQAFFLPFNDKLDPHLVTLPILPDLHLSRAVLISTSSRAISLF